MTHCGCDLRGTCAQGCHYRRCVHTTPTSAGKREFDRSTFLQADDCSQCEQPLGASRISATYLVMTRLVSRTSAEFLGLVIIVSLCCLFAAHPMRASGSSCRPNRLTAPATRTTTTNRYYLSSHIELWECVNKLRKNGALILCKVKGSPS